MLRPFFTFYGGKWRAAKLYPPPAQQIVVEPFAGSAGYSLRYPHKDVVLVEKDPVIAATWRYLIAATPKEIRSIPDIQPGQTVDDLPISDGAKLLVGWWCNKGSNGPRKSLSMWSKGKPSQFWGSAMRERVASQVSHIKHWHIIEGGYDSAPDIKATWFVDPPYQNAGKCYRFGSSAIDFNALGVWCKSRQGRVVVCENEGADWLPFKTLAAIKSNQANNKQKRTTSAEVIYTQGVWSPWLLGNNEVMP